MTLFFYFLLNKLCARSRFSQNQLNLLVEKWTKAVFQHERTDSFFHFHFFILFLTTNMISKFYTFKGSARVKKSKETKRLKS